VGGRTRTGDYHNYRKSKTLSRKYEEEKKMDPNTVRIISGVICIVLIVILIQRRRNKAL
jgi:hypothetical protein